MTTKAHIFVSRLLLILATIINIGLFFMLFVVPVFEAYFADAGISLPLPAKLLLDSSAFARKYAIIIAPLVVAALISAFAWRIYCSVSYYRQVRSENWSN